MALKILLAMDTSEAGRIALAEVAARPWPADASFDVVSVVEPSHLWRTAENVQQSARDAQSAVQDAAAQLSAKNLKATESVLFGDARRVIIERAKQIGAHLIVAGSGGPLGSVAAGVLRGAPCSVEIVRRGTAAGAARRILLAADGSEFRTVRRAQSPNGHGRRARKCGY